MIIGGKPVTDDSSEGIKSDATPATPESKPGNAKADAKKPHGVSDLRTSGDSR